jgi:two-component system alkaline phosphatase synthesis response regulator PhoP
MARILLADDDPFLVQIYSTRLGKDGHEVVTCGDGEAALEKTKEWKPELVVLDIMLPKLTGLEVLASLKGDAGTSKIPVVILSNLTSAEEQDKARELGAVAFLTKVEHTPSQVVKELEKYIR